MLVRQGMRDKMGLAHADGRILPIYKLEDVAEVELRSWDK